MNFNITACSTALFSTWINVEELHLLIDAGDGLTSGLLQKSRKIKNVFITHPDRDHLNGLPQFIQLNSRNDYPKIHYPKDSGSFPALQDFLLKFDPHTQGSKWIGIEHNQIIEISKNYEILAIRNEHIHCPENINKSLSFKLFETRKKLKEEFLTLDQNSIKEIATTRGRDFLTSTIKKNIISFSGDTPIDNYEKWNNSEILIHEATFLRNENKLESRGNKHSFLDEVIKMASEINIKTLILNHFSSRYSKEEIVNDVLKALKKYKIVIPVYAVFPGEIARDILNSNPLNS